MTAVAEEIKSQEAPQVVFGEEKHGEEEEEFVKEEVKLIFTRFECSFHLHSFWVKFSSSLVSSVVFQEVTEIQGWAPSVTLEVKDKVLTGEEEEETIYRFRNLQSYLSTTKLRKLTVVFEYYEAKGTYSRIWVLRS